jgi:hypothetical protein
LEKTFILIIELNNIFKFNISKPTWWLFFTYVTSNINGLIYHAWSHQGSCIVYYWNMSLNFKFIYNSKELQCGIIDYPPNCDFIQNLTMDYFLVPKKLSTIFFSLLWWPLCRKVTIINSYQHYELSQIPLLQCRKRIYIFHTTPNCHSWKIEFAYKFGLFNVISNWWSLCFILMIILWVATCNV